MGCKTELLSPFIDGELPDDEAERLQAHLDSCKNCSDALGVLKGVVKLVHDLPRMDAPAGFLTRLRTKMKETPYPSPAWRVQPRLALGLTAVIAGLVVYAGRSPEPPAAPRAEPASGSVSFDEERPRPKPVQPASSGVHGRPMDAEPPSSVTNEAIISQFKQEADDLKIRSIIPVKKTRKPTDPYALLAARNAQPGSKDEVLAYIQRFRAMKLNNIRKRRNPIAVGGQRIVLISRPLKPSAEGFTDQEVWSGDFSGASAPSALTISTRPEWRAVWSRLSSRPSPEIDFARNQVLAVFAGHKPSGGYAIEIVDIKATESFITVIYRETVPSPGVTAPEGATTPYTLQVVPRSSLPIRFEKTP